MELADFLRQTQANVREAAAEQFRAAVQYPYPELLFAEQVMNHMAEVGMTFEPYVCHYTGKVGNAELRVTGYAISDDADQLDLFVTLYTGRDELGNVSDTDTKTAAERCLRFLSKCADGKLLTAMDESNDAWALVQTVHGAYAALDQIRIYVLTDQVAKTKQFKAREVSGKTVKLEVMDIERLHRHWSEGKPRDELVVDLVEICGQALPCVHVPGEGTDYDCALTAFPGETLRFLYEKYGARLLEANVRSFLSAAGKVNKGIKKTLENDPARFMAYNNGIVVVCDEATIGPTAEGGPGLVWLKGMQIVNGGQTTASIYFTRKKAPNLDLSRVRVPAKVIILKNHDPAAEEALIADISRCANSQNVVRQSDLSANKPYHVEIEKLSLNTWLPDGTSRWFYERATGGYTTMLAREGTTPARLSRIRKEIPSTRKITKTDLAKYVQTWACRPDVVSLGSQKNFEAFMAGLDDSEPLPDAQAFKKIVAQAILFKRTQATVRPLIRAFQANVTTYLVSMIAHRYGDRFDLDRIWMNQDISPQLLGQIKLWAPEVEDALQRHANGRMISESAKKPDCWVQIRQHHFSEPSAAIPELRDGR